MARPQEKLKARRRSRASDSGAPRGKPAWRRDPEGRRRRVLDAAARLVGMHGYRAVTTSMIAAEAGIAEGTLYHYFRTKDALLCAAAARYGQGFAEAMFGGFDPEAGVPDPEQVIARAFAYVRFSDPGFGAFLLADDPGQSLPAKRANRDEIVARLSTLFAAWSGRGWMRKADPRVLAELAFGLVEAGLRECYARGPVDDERERRYITEVGDCVRGILAPRTAS